MGRTAIVALLIGLCALNCQKKTEGPEYDPDELQVFGTEAYKIIEPSSLSHRIDAVEGTGKIIFVSRFASRRSSGKIAVSGHLTRGAMVRVRAFGLPNIESSIKIEIAGEDPTYGLNIKAPYLADPLSSTSQLGSGGVFDVVIEIDNSRGFVSVRDRESQRVGLEVTNSELDGSGVHWGIELYKATLTSASLLL